MAAWKIFETPAEKEVVLTAFNNTRKFFAVDGSGSTGGAPLRSEKDFAVGIHQASTQPNKDWITKWGSRCDNPVNNWEVPAFIWDSNMYGTSPTNILQNGYALACIHSSDIFFLLTDGEVWEAEVEQLASLGQEKGVFSCPTVFMITSYTRESPKQANVSVGITSYANVADALCLFKDYRAGTIYVIAGKGVFAPLDQAKERDTWTGLSSFANEAELIKRIEELEIHVPTAETRGDLPAGADLGKRWNQAHNAKVYVDLLALLQAGTVDKSDLRLLLDDEALDILTLGYKTRGKLAEFRRWLLDNKVEQVAVQLEDVAGAASIIAQLGEPNLSSAVKEELQAKLRAAHATNREKYLEALNDNTAGAAARDQNRLIDHALRQLADIEKAGYTADILSRSSNRARRAETVDASASTVALSILDLTAPAYRGDCQICCGEDEIMSVALKRMDEEATAANTADFALDFPLAAGRFPANMNVISSQCICFQCALFGRPGLSIYAEQVAAVLPALEYSGSNKQYINQQLYLALNGGLKTGVPSLGQLFATILDRTLRTKAWAGAVDPAIEQKEDVEVRKRKETLDWLLQTFLTNLRCRETFSELGEWGSYPKALTWAAKDFETNGLTSWACQYPIAGYNQLIRFGNMTGTFSNELIKDMKATKLMHSLTSAYLAQVLQNQGKGWLWTQPLLEMVYAEFNGELVPRDLGPDNTVLSLVESLWTKLGVFLSVDPDLLAGWSDKEKTKMMPRLQIILFWLVYFQRAHTSAKTWFTNIKSSEPLAPVVLNSKAELSPSVVNEILLSPFVEKDAFINKLLYTLHSTDVIPFATPFGASVLHCGHPACSVSFIPEELKNADVDTVWTPQILDKIRQARAKHLIDVFGIANRFESNQTGLPEPTLLPKAPSSLHTTLHISFARSWARLSIDERRLVVQEFKAKHAVGPVVQEFVAAVRKEICAGQRGNVFKKQLDEEIKDLFPSFFEALKEALELKRLNGEDVSVYEIDFEKNKVELKIKHELAVERMRKE